MLTERQAHRVIHGQFVNTKGGLEKNIANDLKVETMVKDHKKVLRGLCGNKTLKAVQRATSASHRLKIIMEAINRESKDPPDSTQHTHANTEKLVEKMVSVLRNVKPFEVTPGRYFVSFQNITKTPENLNIVALYKWLSSNKVRLAHDAFAVTDDGDDEGQADDVNESSSEGNMTDSNDEDEHDMITVEASYPS